MPKLFGDEFKKNNYPILPIQTLIKNIDDFSQNIRDNAGGYYNHSLFWQMLTPIRNKSNNLPIGISKKIIDYIYLNEFRSRVLFPLLGPK